MQLLFRLRKLSEEATPPPWTLDAKPEFEEAVIRCYGRLRRAVLDGRMLSNEQTDAALIVECRNSLPAVLNLIEAADRAVTTRATFESGTDDDSDSDELFHAWQEAMERLREAVAVFVTPGGGSLHDVRARG